MKKIYIVSSIFILSCFVCFTVYKSNERNKFKGIELQNINQIWEYTMDSKKLNQSNCYIIGNNMDGLMLWIERETNLVNWLLLEFISTTKPSKSRIIDIKYDNNKFRLSDRQTIDTAEMDYNIKENVKVNNILSFISEINLNEIMGLEKYKGEYFELLTDGEPMLFDEEYINDNYAYYTYSNNKLNKLTYLSSEAFKRTYIPVYIGVVSEETTKKNELIYKNNMVAVVLMEKNYE